MPPLACSVTFTAAPTVLFRVPLAIEAIDTLAGMLIVTDCDLVESATEVAVIVKLWLELEAAGAVKVAEEVVVFDSVPPVVLQVTPAALRSLVTAAEMVVESFASTVVAEGVIWTLIAEPPPEPEPELALEPPPQPFKQKAVRIPRYNKTNLLLNITPPRQNAIPAPSKGLKNLEKKPLRGLSHDGGRGLSEFGAAAFP